MLVSVNSYHYSVLLSLGQGRPHVGAQLKGHLLGSFSHQYSERKKIKDRIKLKESHSVKRGFTVSENNRNMYGWLRFNAMNIFSQTRCVCETRMYGWLRFNAMKIFSQTRCVCETRMPKRWPFSLKRDLDLDR